MAQPTRAGQVVTHYTNGGVGMTTDGPRKRTPSIPVQWLGDPYPTMSQVAQLEVIERDAVLSLIAR